MKLPMYLKRSTTIKYIIAGIVGAVLYCEWGIYLIQPWYWRGLECNNHDTSCTKVLFIADPQIQGDLIVSPPLSYLFNWDSDRYVKSTFSVVLKHFEPDVLVYLGDLMDEGSISTMPQFHGYVKRLLNIFDIGYPVVQVWLPGDNDIGGENESVKKDKVEEFDKVFDQPKVITHKNITFYKINAITNTFPKNKENSSNNLKIGLSHMPLLKKHFFMDKIIKEINPNIFFCAHDHESKYVTQNKNFSNRKQYFFDVKSDILNIVFEDEIKYEIFVPTCSYRMGTSKIGFGAAVIENDNQLLRYTVFWSPTRFPYLIFYLFVVVFLFTYFIIFCAARMFYSHFSFKHSVDKQLLVERT